MNSVIKLLLKKNQKLFRIIITKERLKLYTGLTDKLQGLYFLQNLISQAIDLEN
jgi:hypothetical protein